MTAEPARNVGEAGLERSPAAIRAALPAARCGEFDAAYLDALENAKRSYRLDGVHRVLEQWWRLAVLSRVPGHAEAVERGRRILASEEVPTEPVDFAALRG